MTAGGGAPFESFYDQVGGHETFRRLVAEFYKGVADDPPLRAMYPEEDLGPAEERLRMRHHPFKVTPVQRDRWLHHMMAAVESLDLPPANDLLLRDYLERAAYSMVNALED